MQNKLIIFVSIVNIGEVYIESEEAHRTLFQFPNSPNTANKDNILNVITS